MLKLNTARPFSPVVPNRPASPTTPPLPPASKPVGAQGTSAPTPNGRVDGFDAGGAQGARPSLPAGSLMDAFQTALGQGSQTPASAPNAPSAPPAETGIPKATDTRPPGDTRSAAQILEGSPALANLGRQKDIKFEQLCKQTGVDPNLDLKDSRQNPDAVYRLAKVVDFIDSSKDATGGDRTSKVQGAKGDGNIEGITKDGDARHGTEAGMLKDFAEQGYGSLSANHQLPTTSDSHVKQDGSNKDNFQWFAGEVGKKLWFIPGLSNVLTGVGESEGGFLGALKGGLGGMLKTWKGVAEGVIGSLGTGKVNPFMLALGAYKGALGQTDAAPSEVKQIVNLLP